MNENQHGRAPQRHPEERASGRRNRRRKHKRQRTARLILMWGLVAAAAIALVIGVPKLLNSAPAAPESEKASSLSAAPESTPAASGSTASSAAEAASESEAQPVETAASFVCTWDTAGQEGYDYLLAVNRVGNCVTVFTKDADGNYTVPYKAMISSSGDATPIGTYSTIEKYRWRLLEGNVYGQYATRITGHILFHSVPYFTQNINDLEYEEFNKLGTPASLGCIRLQVEDAKWIYDNCPVGTPTVLYDDAACPGPLGQPDFTHIDETNETLRSWDPTDPDDANPWKAA